MFVGHYGVSLAIKKKETNIPLWLLFIAVQWVDILFCLFVLTGVESLRIIPGFTAYNAFDLHFMPYTHSLLGALLCSLVFGFAAAYFVRPRSAYKKTALWLFVAAFSHFLLDLPMHVKDLLLMPGSEMKFGFGLWNHFYLSMAVELCVFAIGLWIFGVRNRRYPFWILVVLCVTMLVANPFMPPPQSATEFALSALTAYGLLAALAWWAERSQTTVLKNAAVGNTDPA